MRFRALAPAVLASAALALTVSGCSASVSIGGNSVSTEDLESTINDELAKQVGAPPEKLTCPDALEAEVGAEVRCTLTDDGDTFDVLVTATSVDGDDVGYDFEVVDAE